MNIYSAPDRLDLIAHAADIAKTLTPQVGVDLFAQAVDTATAINDDAARLLTVHADLARRAAIQPSDRMNVASRLVRAADNVAPQVTAPDVVPYEAIVRAAAKLHATTGLVAASRWDDEDGVSLAATLPAALVGAVEGKGYSAEDPQRSADPATDLLEVTHVGADRAIGQPGRSPSQHEPGETSVSMSASSSGVAGTPDSRRSRTAARLNPRLLVFTDPTERSGQTIKLLET